MQLQLYLSLSLAVSVSCAGAPVAWAPPFTRISPRSTLSLRTPSRARHSFRLGHFRALGAPGGRSRAAGVPGGSLETREASSELDSSSYALVAHRNLARWHCFRKSTARVMSERLRERWSQISGASQRQGHQRQGQSVCLHGRYLCRWLDGWLRHS